MKDQLAMKDTFRFAAAGSLQRPGPIGRLVRLAMGVFLAWIVWQLAFRYGVSGLTQPAAWFWIVFALGLAPYVVNIGFGVTWGAWPRIAGGLLLAAGAAVGYFQDDTVIGQPLWAATLVFMTYIYVHLGISFLLSALLATPGCEMRAIPHLIGIVRGKSSDEHYCPGFIDNVDRWERERKLPAEQRGNPNVRKNDLLRDGKRMLLLYGIPFAAIQVTGFVGGPGVAAIVWTAGFAVMGLAGIANTIQSHRVHGFFTGPWFLLTAVAVALRYLGVIDISGPVLLNTGLFVGVLLYFVSEGIWGKYFGEDQSVASA